MLSSRSGTVTKAKDPARAIIRGKAMKSSLGEKGTNEVLLDVEDMVRWASEGSDKCKPEVYLILITLL